MSDPLFAALDAVGLNLQAVFSVSSLPASMRDGSMDGFTQLILIGNAGPALWRSARAAALDPEHPIDAFSVDAVGSWLDGVPGGDVRRVCYPGEAPFGLQALGALAGWHHPSPFMVGIQPEWGTWFAYRVAVLTNTALPLTPRRESTSPCEHCADRPCVSACPADAMAHGAFSLADCVRWRLAPESSCADTCQARLACPVGSAHRYDTTQIRHGYAQSLAMIRSHQCPPPGPAQAD